MRGESVDDQTRGERKDDRRGVLRSEACAETQCEVGYGEKCSKSWGARATTVAQMASIGTRGEG